MTAESAPQPAGPTQGEPDAQRNLDEILAIIADAAAGTPPSDVLLRREQDRADREVQNARRRSDQAFLLALLGLACGGTVTLAVALYALYIISTASTDGAGAAAATVAAFDLAAIAATFVYGSRGAAEPRRQQGLPENSE